MDNIKNIAIIGAGTAGLFTGYNLKKLDKNLAVTIYEEHSHLKKTCSGILTENITSIIKIPNDVIINRISKAKIIAPNDNFIQLNFRKPDIVVDREKFNKYLRKLAEKQGCKIVTDARFERIDTDNTITIKRKNKTEKISADILIGADGALSRVAKSSGMWEEKDRFFYLGIKAKISMNSDEVLFYPFVNDFAWILPLKKNLCEIGLAKRMHGMHNTIDANTDMKKHFEDFVSLLENKSSKKIKLTPKEIESALIPEYKKISLSKKAGRMQTYLVGDAALHVKATTLGGIIPNLKAAKILAESIVKNQNYELRLSRLNLELMMHKKARKILNKFSDAEWNKLIDEFQNKKLIKILNETSRDEPKKLAIKLFKAKPSLIKYGRYLI